MSSESSSASPSALLSKDEEVHIHRILPIGAEARSAGGVHFRVWAPSSAHVRVVISTSTEMTESTEHLMEPEDDGYHQVFVASAKPGDFYKFKVEGGMFPDPASRFQPAGPHGASQIVDGAAFNWTDCTWAGVSQEGQVIYELHIGTFTKGGTWMEAMKELPALADLGVTLLEVMPVADFPGRFGWGYDGVNLFAPCRLYGTPDEFRQFVDQAHRLGLGVILDVVYNHLGPDGNYLAQYSPHYFTLRHRNEWGDAINFDDEDSRPVRELFASNAEYWIREFHLDGLRFDAAHQIFDDSDEHIVAEIARRCRAIVPNRGLYLVAESETQVADLVRPQVQGGMGLDGVWNDDFHHSARVAMTGRNEAYYSQHEGTPQEFISAAKWGFIYQGQYYSWQKKPRGTPSLDLAPSRFVVCLQNHDQVANSLWGRRVHRITSPGMHRAMTALLLLGPATPMLFMGQEYSASTPFLYFGDHVPDLAKKVAAGRAEFLSQFPGIASPGASSLLTNPEEKGTYIKCKLRHEERHEHAEVLQLHRDLIRLRHRDRIITHVPPRGCDGAVLGERSFLLRYFGPDNDDRLLLVNLGPGLRLKPASEPLLAPPHGRRWGLLWSSEDTKYGGDGTPARIGPSETWFMPGHSTMFLHTLKLTRDESATTSKNT